MYYKESDAIKRVGVIGFHGTPCPKTREDKTVNSFNKTANYIGDKPINLTLNKSHKMVQV